MVVPKFLQQAQAWIRGRQERFRKSRFHWLLSDKWFPHIPLAVFVALLGVLRVAPAFQQTFEWPSFLENIVQSEKRFALTSLRGLPDAIPGIFLVVMALGLLLRSRLAWIITVLFLLASMAIDVIDYYPKDSAGLIVYNIVLLAALFVWRKHFGKSSLAAATLFSMVSIFTLLGYALVGTYELGEHFLPKIEDVYTALYYVIVTMSTVGYGDITPQTTEARMFAISIIILGITVFATSLSAILMPLINKRMKRMMKREDPQMGRSEHYIIVGDSALSRNTYRQLKTRGETVTVILPSMPEDSQFEPDDVVTGDGSDLDVLKNVKAADAKAVLALGNNDSENAFVVLAAKELAAGLKTVAGVSSSGNLARVRSVKPDIVLSPQILGAEILALALSDDKIDIEGFLSRIFHKSD